MQDGFVVQAQQLIGAQSAGQRGEVLPAGGAILFVFQAIGGELLQQHAAGTTTVGEQLETRANLLRHDEIVGETVRQCFAVEIDNALIALADSRVDGEGQNAVRHEIAEGGVCGDLLGVVTRQTTDLTLAGALDHQQRNRPFRACLQNQQAIELERADQQRSGRHQFAEQLRDRFRVRVFGEDFGVAALQRYQFAASVAVIEDEALSEIGIR